MTYSEAIEYLHSLGQFSMRLGLERAHQLAQALGHPERGLRFIHVAGTNGKGSTCAFLESIYRSAGYHVGLFTSPHLVHFGERIQVGRQPLPEAKIVKLVARLKAVVETFPAEDHPTFFEVVTAMALLHFSESRCDLVIWETGLGGRLDATNIVTPLASVITRIGLDHQQWLGDTPEKIATEKAGIIKPGVPCLSAPQLPGVEQVIRETCLRQNCPLHLSSTALPGECQDLTLPLAGLHQRQNAALALATVEVLQSQVPVPPAAKRAGLLQTTWPGRFQRIETSGGVLLLDGAHNADGAQVLRHTFETEYPGRRAAFIIGVLRDKSWESLIESLLPLMSRLILVPVDSNRSAAPEDLEPFCRSHAPQLPIDRARSLPEAIDKCQQSPLTVITGSLYLVGQALELLERSTLPFLPERSLNEWAPKAH